MKWHFTNYTGCTEDYFLITQNYCGLIRKLIWNDHAISRCYCTVHIQLCRTWGSILYLRYSLHIQYVDIIPSNAHISTPLFQKTVFFSKICFGNPPTKFLQECLNSENMWQWSQVYNFNSARALKKLLSSGVEVTSTLPNSDKQKDLLM